MNRATNYITDAELITGIVLSHFSEDQKRELIDLADDFDHEERIELMKLIEASRNKVSGREGRKLKAFIKLTLTLAALVGIAVYIINHFKLI